MKRTAIAVLPMALAACAVVPPPESTPPSTGEMVWARIGQRVDVDGPKVTPLELLEDSRCPKDVQCVWAGQVRIRARVEIGSGTREIDLTQGKPVPVADGALELVETRPPRLTTAKTAPSGYSFGLRFRGGL